METAAFYFKLMEKFCDGRIVVQDKKKRRGGGRKRKPPTKKKQKEDAEQDLHAIWDTLSPSVAAVLGNGEFSVPEQDHPIPFDATADKAIDDQK